MDCRQTRHPLQRHGTHQRERLLETLIPSNLKLDDRSMADLLSFAGEFAKHVRYWDQDNSPAGDWTCFWEKDATPLLAIVASTDLETLRTQYRDLELSFYKLKKEEEGKQKSAQTDEVPASNQVLEDLVLYIFNTAKQIQALCAKVPARHPLKLEIARIIKEKLRQPLTELIAYHKGIAKENLISQYQEAGFLSPDACGQAWGMTEEDFLCIDYWEKDYDSQVLWELFLAFYKALAVIVSLAEKAFNKSLYGRSDHPPHIALFLTFLHLFRYLQDEINNFTEKHLIYYYHEVLLLQERREIPDRVHLVFELAQNVERHLLAKGVQFLGGKDAFGLERYYALEDELVVSRAKLVEKKNMYINPEKCQIIALPAADKKDGVKEKYDDGQKVWAGLSGQNLWKKYDQKVQMLTNLFTSGRLEKSSLKEVELKQANKANRLPKPIKTVYDKRSALEFKTGFSIHSPELWLEKSPSRGYVIEISEDSADNKILQNFDVEISTEAGVQEVENQVGEDPITIILSILNGTSPAVIFDMVIEGKVYYIIFLSENFGAVRPIEGEETPFLRFKSNNCLTDKVNRITLFSYSLGLKDLILQVGATVFPSTAEIPIILGRNGSSNLYIGAKELMNKKIKVIKNDNNEGDNAMAWPFLGETMNIRTITKSEILQEALKEMVGLKVASDAWPNLRKVIDEIIVPIDGSSLNFGNSPRGEMLAAGRSNRYLLNSGMWFELPTIDNPGLFNTSDINTITQKKQFDIGDKYGFFRVGLGFSRNLLFAEGDEGAVVANDAFLFTIPPESIFIGYVSEGITFPARSNAASLHHLKYQGPFGEHEIVPDERKQFQLTPPYMQPALDHTFGLMPVIEETTYAHGNLFLGFEEITPGQVLSLLIHTAEGTGNPEKIAPEIRWSYLRDNEWLQLPPQFIVKDETFGMQRTGILRFLIPTDINNGNTWIKGEEGRTDLFWLRASAAEDPENNISVDALPMLRDIFAQAEAAVFQNNGNNLAHLEEGIPEKTIANLRFREVKIRSTTQPFRSFGGRFSEVGDRLAYYRRIQERLRHRQRAVNIYDYERLLLEVYPKIAIAKCLPHSAYAKHDSVAKPGHVQVAVLPYPDKMIGIRKFYPSVDAGDLSEMQLFLNRHNSIFVSGQGGTHFCCCESEKTPTEHDCNCHHCDNRLQVINARMEPVRLQVCVRFKANKDIPYYTKQLNDDLKGFLAPWAVSQSNLILFGASVSSARLLQFVEMLDYVDVVMDLKFKHFYNREQSEEYESELPWQQGERIEPFTSRSVLTTYLDVLNEENPNVIDHDIHVVDDQDACNCIECEVIEIKKIIEAELKKNKGRPVEAILKSDSFRGQMNKYVETGQLKGDNPIDDGVARDRDAYSYTIKENELEVALAIKNDRTHVIKIPINKFAK